LVLPIIDNYLSTNRKNILKVVETDTKTTRFGLSFVLSRFYFGNAT
jgi:hypothetical protein